MGPPPVISDGPLEVERVLSLGLAEAELDRGDAELLERLERELVGRPLELLARELPGPHPWRPAELLAPGGPIPQGPLV